MKLSALLAHFEKQRMVVQVGVLARDVVIGRVSIDEGDSDVVELELLDQPHEPTVWIPLAHVTSVQRYKAPAGWTVTPLDPDVPF